MLSACAKNQLKVRYVLSDVWYASSENMRYIKQELKKNFIMPLKSNRKVALSLEDKKQGNYERVTSLELEPGKVREVYVEQEKFPLVLVKQIFKNEDGSEGVLYLVSSDVTLNYERLTTIYQRRWKVEEYHKSLESNASVAKSPTKTTRMPSACWLSKPVDVIRSCIRRGSVAVEDFLELSVLLPWRSVRRWGIVAL